MLVLLDIQIVATFFKMCFNVSPVKSDAEHPVLSEGRHKQLNILRPLPVLGQRSLQQGYGAHSGENSDYYEALNHDDDVKENKS